MSLLVFQQGEHVALKIVEPGVFHYHHEGTDIFRHRQFVPTLAEIEQLPRPLMVNMLRDVVPVNARMNKHTLANLIRQGWQEVSTNIAYRFGAESIFDDVANTVTEDDDDAASSIAVAESLTASHTEDEDDEMFLINLDKTDLNSEMSFLPYTMTLKVATMNGDIAMTYHFDDQMTGHSLMALVEQVSGGRLNYQNTALYLRDIDIPIYQSLHSCVDNDMVVTLVPRLRGGVFGGVRRFINKQEAIASLVEKSKNRIRQRTSTTEIATLEGNPPRQFADVLNVIEDKIRTYRHQMLSGELTMDTFLNRLPDNKIEELIAIFDYQTNSHTEEKVVIAVDVIYEDAQALEALPPFIKKAKEVIVFFFLEFFARECSSMRGANIGYTNKRFLKSLTDIQSYRRGLRANSTNEPVAESRVEAGCILS